MSSKTATKLYNDSRDFLSLARKHVGTVQTELTRRLGPELREGEMPPSWELPQNLVMRLVESLGARLIEQDDGYAQSQFEDRKRRDAQRALGRQVKIHLTDARNLFRRLFGSGKGITLAELDARLNKVGPRGLVRTGRQLVETLRKPGFSFPPAEPSLLVPQPLAYADTIEQSVDRLEATLEEDKGVQADALAFRQWRDDNLDETRDGVRRCRQFLIGLFQLAGLDIPAEAMRPAGRKRAATEGEAPTKVDPGASPDGTTAPKKRRSRRRAKVKPPSKEVSLQPAA